MPAPRSESHSPERTPGQRAGLDRAAVLVAARDALATDGIDGLSMRSIARRLGVSPNAIYSHVADKTDLIDAVLDDLLGEVAAPPAEMDDPIDGLTAIMQATFETLCAHSDLVPLYLSRQGSRGPNARRLGIEMDRYLHQLQLGDQLSAARRALITFTIGSAAFAPAPTESGTDAVVAVALDAAAVRANFHAGLHWMLAGMAPGHA